MPHKAEGKQTLTTGPQKVASQCPTEATNLGLNSNQSWAAVAKARRPQWFPRHARVCVLVSRCVCVCILSTHNSVREHNLMGATVANAQLETETKTKIETATKPQKKWMHQRAVRDSIENFEQMTDQSLYAFRDRWLIVIYVEESSDSIFLLLRYLERLSYMPIFPVNFGDIVAKILFIYVKSMKI